MLSTAVLMAASMIVGQTEREHIPKEAIAELGRLVGTWEMTGKEGGENFKAEYHIEWAEGRCGLLLQCRWFRDSEARGLGMLAWDDSKKGIFQPEAYDDGSISRLNYTQFAPDVWAGEAHNTVVGKGEYKASIKLEFADKDHFSWTATKASLNGNPQSDMELKFTRAR